MHNDHYQSVNNADDSTYPNSQDSLKDISDYRADMEILLEKEIVC